MYPNRKSYRVFQPNRVPTRKIMHPYPKRTAELSQLMALTDPSRKKMDFLLLHPVYHHHQSLPRAKNLRSEPYVSRVVKRCTLGSVPSAKTFAISDSFGCLSGVLRTSCGAFRISKAGFCPCFERPLPTSYDHTTPSSSFAQPDEIHR